MLKQLNLCQAQGSDERKVKSMKGTNQGRGELTQNKAILPFLLSNSTTQKIK